MGFQLDAMPPRSFDNPVRAHEVRSALAVGVIIASILIGVIVGNAPLLLRTGSPTSYEIGLGLLVSGATVVVLFTWFTLRREENYLPERVRIFPDKVLADYSLGRAMRSTKGSLTFPFTDGTFILGRTGFWSSPRVVNLVRPTYLGEVRALILTPANLAEVKKAWTAWKASPHESDLSPAEAPLRTGSPLRTEEDSSVIWWHENGVASIGRHTLRLRQAATVAGIMVSAFFVLEVVILTPYVGLLWAIYWAVAWFPLDLMLLIPWLIILFPFYPWWFKDIPRIGLDEKGVHLRHRSRKERVIPWMKVGGPTHQTFGENWLLFFQLPDGTFSAKDYTVVDEKMAQTIAHDPRCPRQKMVRADAMALGLITDSASPHSME